MIPIGLHYWGCFGHWDIFIQIFCCSPAFLICYPYCFCDSLISCFCWLVCVCVSLSFSPSSRSNPQVERYLILVLASQHCTLCSQNHSPLSQCILICCSDLHVVVVSPHFFMFQFLSIPFLGGLLFLVVCMCLGGKNLTWTFLQCATTKLLLVLPVQ